MDPVAAWSRDDLVPVGFIGYAIDELALGPRSAARGPPAGFT